VSPFARARTALVARELRSGQMSGASERFKELARGPASELRRLFSAGELPCARSLVGYEFRGFNHPPLMSLLGIRKFIKAFFTVGDVTFGCNTPVEQNGLDGEWLAEPSEANPRRYGFFCVAAADRPDGDEPGQALLLDYGQGHNKPYDPSGLLRDYVVRVDPGSNELLLGKAYLALGPVRVPVCFFLLERYRPTAVPPQLPS
jgi:hypothetical protein